MLETLLLIADHQKNSLSTWVTDKKFKPTDFPVLNLLKTDEEKFKMTEVLQKCKSLNASFSETVQLVEIATELLLMNFNSPLFDQSQNLGSWKNHLHQLRFPQATSSDATLKTKFEKLPWPAGAKTKFERRGDRAGVELKLFITSQADLIKAISALERVKDEI